MLLAHFRNRYFSFFIPIALCTLLGMWIVSSPAKAFMLVGGLAFFALINIQPFYLCTGALLAATVVRVLASLGAPHFLNFLHFPLLLLALFIAVLTGRSSEVSRPLGYGLVLFLAVNLVSWWFNGGEFLRPLLDWLVLTEPFLLVYTLALCPMNTKFRVFSWKLLLGISALQIPFAFYQWRFTSHGNPDRVQGTFIGQGAGAHIAGAMALIGVLILVCFATAERGISKKPLLLVGAALLFSVAVIADAKQAIFAFIIGIGFAIAWAAGAKLLRLIAPVAAMTVIIYVAFVFYQPLQLIFNNALISGGLQGKIMGGNVLVDRLLDHSGGWLLGVGPGNSVSRVALLTSDARLDGTSPLATLGLKTAPLTREMLSVSSGNRIWNSSSAFSTEASWFGIVGDLGLMGTVIYLWLAIGIWRSLKNSRSWEAASTKGALVAAIFLGGIYSWLEEPGFVLPIALMISLAQSKVRDSLAVEFNQLSQDDRVPILPLPAFSRD